MAELIVIVTARDEAECIGATVRALRRAFPAATLWVADDGSADDTARLAQEAGANVSGGAAVGKGGAATRAVRVALEDHHDDAIVLLCDGDLGESAGQLAPLVLAVADGSADLAVAAFARRVGGGFGLALGFARWAIHRCCGLLTQAPISGQRALSARTARRLLPFADGFGMEMAMTIDAVRLGCRVREIELDLSHRATTKTMAGFLHRARQLADFLRVYHARR